MDPKLTNPHLPTQAPTTGWTLRTLAGLFLLLTVYLLLTTMVHAQVAHRPLAPLQPLIEEGLAHNLGVRQQYVTQQRQAEALRQARGLFFPTLSVQARYSRLYGNVIDFGTILNPVLTNLNGINRALNTGVPAYPTDLVIRLPLVQETRLNLTQPLFRPEILANYRAQKALLAAEDAATAARKRQLIADVQTAYLNHARAQRVIQLLRQTESLLAENLRTSQRLVSADRATPDVVSQARAELADVQQRQVDAQRQADAARQYLNHLLGRPLDDAAPVVDDSLLLLDAPVIQPREAVLAHAANRRDELMQLARSLDASRQGERAASANFLPNLGLGVDYGVQGQYYAFNANQDYMIASLSASWTLFNGFQNRAKREQARLETERLELRRQETADLIQLQTRQAYDDLAVAQASIRAAEERATAAQRTFDMVRRRYDEGLANQVEYTQARTSYTNAGINRILTHYELLLRRVALERAAALYPLN